jgi:hypothetical protein
MKNLTFAALSITAAAVALGTSITAANAVKPISISSLLSDSTPLSEPAVVVATTTLAQASGQFVTVDQDHATTGTARIVTTDGQRYLEFDGAFDTARGPAVEVILYTGATVPVSIDEADYITLAPLQSFSGAQRYAIPAEVNLDDYQTVGIWCQQFNVTFGYAPL